MLIHLETAIGPFEGPMTAQTLTAALAPLPAEATVTIEAWDTQESEGWRVRAHWTEERPPLDPEPPVDPETPEETP